MRRMLLVLVVLLTIAAFAAPATAEPGPCLVDCDSASSVETTTGN